MLACDFIPGTADKMLLCQYISYSLMYMVMFTLILIQKSFRQWNGKHFCLLQSFGILILYYYLVLLWETWIGFTVGVLLLCLLTFYCKLQEMIHLKAKNFCYYHYCNICEFFVYIGLESTPKRYKPDCTCLTFVTTIMQYNVNPWIWTINMLQRSAIQPTYDVQFPRGLPIEGKTAPSGTDCTCIHTDSLSLSTHCCE